MNRWMQLAVVATCLASTMAFVGCEDSGGDDNDSSGVSVSENRATITGLWSDGSNHTVEIPGNVTSFRTTVQRSGESHILEFSNISSTVYTGGSGLTRVHGFTLVIDSSETISYP